jgi:putative nucleotidyltransferase with HDIG domain
MKHDSRYLTTILIAGILGLSGQLFLLLPNRVQNITTGLSSLVVTALGVFFFTSALLAGMMIVIPAHPRQQRPLIGLAASLTFLLVFLYLRGGLFVETLLLSNILASFVICHLVGKRGPDFERHILHGTTTISNLSTGIFLLANYVRIQDPLYMQLGGMQVALGIVFILSAILATVVFFLPSAKEGNLLLRALALPWLAWALFFAASLSIANTIAPLFVSAAILVGDQIPWHKFALPEEDLLGRRLILTGALTTLGGISFLAILLELLDQALASLILPVREITFIFFSGMVLLVLYAISTATMTIHGLMSEPAELPGQQGEENLANQNPDSWEARVARYLRPFSLTRSGLYARLHAQADQINVLSRQLNVEKHHNAQLTLLTELSQQLENQLDQPVAAQLTVNSLAQALDCDLVCLYTHEAEHREMVVLASAGRKTHILPPGYRQGIGEGILGRAVRLRKTQVVNDTRFDPDHFNLEHENSLSVVVIPLIHNGHLKGAIEITSEKTNAFSSTDIALAEMMAAELLRGWERSAYYQRLTELIEAGVSLSSVIDPQVAVEEIATIARQTLKARFVFVKINLGREENSSYIAFAGHAPRLLTSLSANGSGEKILKTGTNAIAPFRIRDLRKYQATAKLDLDHSGLRSALVVPIRLHRLSIGVLLAFGKQGEVFFSENDEWLAGLLAMQAAGAFESTWLQKELRTTLTTTTLLYRLSTHIIQSEELREAARAVAETAYKLAGGGTAGIVLFKPQGSIEVEVEVDSNGAHSGTRHPMDLIEQVMKTGQAIYHSPDQIAERICFPIQTPMRRYGVLWLIIPSRGKVANPADLRTLANQAAIALERALLMVESRRQAKEIEAAYHELELTYDRTLAALTTALDARDRETEGHSVRVSQLAVELGKALGLTPQQLKALERGSLLHDIGKIGISDTILHKPGPLTPEEWASMRQHPDIGARIVEDIPFLQETLHVIRYHQERWDGSGYPVGLSGKDIPLLARIFAVVDAFDALTSNRPYRQKITPEEALAYLRAQAGILFDPEIVAVFVRLIESGTVADLVPLTTPHE